MAFTPFHLYFDDLQIGQEWFSLGRTVTEADIVNFAGFSGDFNPIHLDHHYARSTPFRQPIAHGLAVFSMASGLGVQCPPVRTVALVSMTDWLFRQPVYVGDTIRVRTTVLEKTLKGRGKRGEVLWHRAVLNHDDQVVQEGRVITLVEARLPNPSTSASPTHQSPSP